MRTKVAIGATVALAALAVAVWLFLRGDSVDLSPQVAPERDAARVDGPEVDLDPVELAAAADSEAAEAPDEEAAEAEDETAEPVLLQGRVVGEGQGIAGAEVRLFAVAEIEQLLVRAERLIPQGGEIPDVPTLIAAVRSELERFRSLAILTVTDEDGYFALRELSEGGYIALTLAPGWLFRYGDVVSLSKARTEEITIELDRGSWIRGTVVRSDGVAAAGVRVVAEYRPPGLPGVGKLVRRALRLINGEFLKGPFEAVSGADGSFVLDSLPSGVYDLAAASEEGVETRLESVETGSDGVVLALGEGAWLEGFVVDGVEVPVPALTVELERMDERIELPPIAAGFSQVANTVYEYLGEPPRRIETAGDGGFRFGPLGAGRYRLSIEQPGFLPASRDVELAWGQREFLGVIRVDRGEILEGLVLDAATGKPISAASILAFPAQPNFLTMGNVANDVAVGRLQVRSDEDGRFRLAGLRRTDYRVIVTRSGYAPENRVGVRGGAEPLELRLERGRAISGRIVEAGTEEPVAGVMVRSGGVRVRTDSEGLFVLDGVSVDEEGGSGRSPFGGRRGPPRGASTSGDGEPSVGDAAPEREPEPPGVSVRTGAKGWISRRVRVPVEQLDDELVIEIERAPSIGGVVLDPDGEPIAGALVRITPTFPPEMPDFGVFDRSLIFLGVTVSDLDGRFSFDELPPVPGGRFQAIADHVLHARGQSESFTFGESASPPGELEVRLLPACTVKGVVVSGGDPVPRVVLRLARRRELRDQERFFVDALGLPSGGTEAHSGPSGEFEYGNVTAGAYTLSASVAGFTDPEPIAVDVAPGETREVRIELDPGGEIVGVVVDTAGEPVADASVRVLRLEGTPERLLEAQRFLGGAYRRGITDLDGGFTVDGLPKGSYAVIASKAGYRRADLDGIEPGAGRIELVLERSAALSGRVVDLATGAPVTSFSVTVVESDRAEPDPMPWRGVRQYTDAEGFFSREDIVPGVYEVDVKATGFVGASARIEFIEGARVEKDFALARSGRLEGLVLDAATGQPLEGATVALVPVESSGAASEDGEPKSAGDRSEKTAPGELASQEADPAAEDGRAIREYFSRGMRGETTTSGVDGSFLLDTIPEGEHRLEVSHPAYVSWERSGVRIGVGEALEVVPRLEAGLRLGGVVRDADGRPVSGFSLLIRGTDEETRRVRKVATTDDEGRYRLEGLREGSYRLIGVGRRQAVEIAPRPVTLTGSRFDLDLAPGE